MMHLPPMEYCRVVHDYVRLDQSCRECAAEQRCRHAPEGCPLRSDFCSEPPLAPRSGSVVRLARSA